MKVEFRTNLGSRDAADLNRDHDADLDHLKCSCGSVHDLSDGVARALVGRGIAQEVAAEPKAKPAPKAPEPSKA